MPASKLQGVVSVKSFFAFWIASSSENPSSMAFSWMSKERYNSASIAGKTARRVPFSLRTRLASRNIFSTSIIFGNNTELTDTATSN